MSSIIIFVLITTIFTVFGYFSVGVHALILIPTIVWVLFFPGVLLIYFVWWKCARKYISLDRIARFIIGRKKEQDINDNVHVGGILGVLPIYFIELGIQYSFHYLVEEHFKRSFNTYAWIFFSQFFESFIMAALIEESFKLFVAAVVISIDKQHDKPFTVLVLTMACALGMGCFETIEYTFSVEIRNFNFETTIITGVLRSFIATTFHVSTAIYIGGAIGNRRFHYLNLNYFRIMLFPILLHGFYDFSILLFTKLYSHTANSLFYLLFLLLILVNLLSTTLAIRTVRSFTKSSQEYDYSLLELTENE